MKLYITLVLLICFSMAFCQERGVVLKAKASNRSVFLSEHKRIKLKTKDGKVFVGKFTIVDDHTIMIKDTPIALDSIVKIKRRSLVSSIGSPIVFAVGATLVITGIAGAVSGGYAVVLVVLIPPGIPMVLLPAISNNHKPQTWEYSIDTNPKLKKI
jgi:small nuclear ribonucleoprotein (snRNP)-like protein